MCRYNCTIISRPFAWTTPPCLLVPRKCYSVVQVTVAFRTIRHVTRHRGSDLSNFGPLSRVTGGSVGGVNRALVGSGGGALSRAPHSSKSGRLSHPPGPVVEPVGRFDCVTGHRACRTVRNATVLRAAPRRRPFNVFGIVQ